jgi:hypothetical protein
MNQSLEQQIQTGIQTVYAKAATDPVFRKLCVSNPNAAIKQALDVDVPAWAKVKMVDTEGANFTFVLPEPKPVSGELKDEDLEHVAGGAAKGPMVISPGAGGGGGGGGAPPVFTGGGISGIPGNQKGGGGGGGGGPAPTGSGMSGPGPLGSYMLNKKPK